MNKPTRQEMIDEAVTRGVPSRYLRRWGNKYLAERQMAAPGLAPECVIYLDFWKEIVREFNRIAEEWACKSSAP